MRTLNLGIVAHVDAGKTSLTERLLFAAGVIGEVGSVDAGNTQTDSLALERQRGITIKSAVVSFVLGDVSVNLIDTPGHPDFIAEVERVLGVLDGAVLVISAVEGVQAQSRVLMRALRRLRIPVLLFVNKIDRGGAGYQRVLLGIAEKLTPGIIAMGSARDLGTRAAGFTPYGAGDAAFTARLAELLADHDDALLAAYLQDESAVSYGRLRGELAAQARRGLVHPVFFGSAMTGAGVDSLAAGIRELLPAAQGDAGGPVSGTVFKIERGAAGETIAYARMFSGTVRARDRLRFGHDREGKVTAVSVFDRGAAVRRAPVTAGQIGKLWGLAGIRIGDTLGVRLGDTLGVRLGDTLGVRLGDTLGVRLGGALGVRLGGALGDTLGGPPAARRSFAPPTLETAVVPARPADKGALRVALAQLAEQDPLINLRQDDVRQELYVSLYGEVQKEVIQSTLATDFGIDAGFRETTTICIERPIGTGAAAEFMGQEPNPFRATVGLRIDPATTSSGVQFRLEVEPGSMPSSFFKAVEETVRETLRQGLCGWQVTDCTVTMTHSGYTPPPPFGWSKWSSTAGDFRNLTPLVAMSVLRQARTTVYEPMHRFHLEIPADTLGPMLPVLAGLRAVPQAPAMRGSSCLLEGEIPAARMHELQQQLPALTRGEGVLEGAFDHYQPIHGAIPTRPRSDHNPLNRKEYLLHVLRRAGGRSQGG